MSYAPSATTKASTTPHGAERPGGWSGAKRPAFNPARDRTITRLAVLKAAAAFAASRPEASSADVLKVAAAWERWITR